MICNKLNILLILSLLFFSCCAPTQAQKEAESAKIIRQLAPAAAGIPEKDFIKFANTGQAPDRNGINNNQPLTLIIMCHVVSDIPKEIYMDRFAEFQFSSLTPNPNKLVQLLKPSVDGERWSALQDQHITDLTCEVDDDTAKGIISFDAGIYSGQVHYTANKEGRNWQIDEFSFPVHDWRFTRNKDGNWEWFDHFGRIEKDRKLPLQDVEGKVLLDDQPLLVYNLKFSMVDYPEFDFLPWPSRRKRKPDEVEFMVSLPPGKYAVTFTGKEFPNDAYKRRSSSELIVEIEEGQSELEIELKSTEK